MFAFPKAVTQYQQEDMNMSFAAGLIIVAAVGGIILLITVKDVMSPT